MKYELLKPTKIQIKLGFFFNNVKICKDLTKDILLLIWKSYLLNYSKQTMQISFSANISVKNLRNKQTSILANINWFFKSKLKNDFNYLFIHIKFGTKRKKNIDMNFSSFIIFFSIWLFNIIFSPLHFYSLTHFSIWKEWPLFCSLLKSTRRPKVLKTGYRVI